MVNFDYKKSLTDGFNKYVEKHGTKPNAVWVEIKIKNADGYDTPYFEGYVLILSNEQIDAYVENETLPNDVHEIEVIYVCSSINSIISDVEEGYTEFTITKVGSFEYLSYYGNKKRNIYPTEDD